MCSQKVVYDSETEKKIFMKNFVGNFLGYSWKVVETLNGYIGTHLIKNLKLFE